MWDELARALALVLVIEGLLPFAAPGRWRLMLAQIVQMPNRPIRIAGAISMAAGLILLQLLRNS